MKWLTLDVGGGLPCTSMVERVLRTFSGVVPFTRHCLLAGRGVAASACAAVGHMSCYRP